MLILFYRQGNPEKLENVTSLARAKRLATEQHFDAFRTYFDDDRENDGWFYIINPLSSYGSRRGWSRNLDSKEFQHYYIAALPLRVRDEMPLSQRG